MQRRIVECVPNFSEGRRQGVIDAIVESIRDVRGVLLLDVSSDADHNRSVVTFAGEPEAVLEGAFAGIQTAAEKIDLDKHQGQHPRIGAADVVPFVPLQGMTLDDCAAMARQLGQRVGDELGLPVYLYAHAATRPDRQDLQAIRRGGYEALKEAVLTDPGKQPDFGPARLGTAGATVIGARVPLVAFNVFLTTDDVQIARRIAAAVRHSSGGYHSLKSLGFLVRGRAQVSMNFTDPTRTPIARVVETIRREAARYGVSIHHTELIGLIPQAALLDAARWYLQLDALRPGQVLETALRTALDAHPE